MATGTQGENQTNNTKAPPADQDGVIRHVVTHRMESAQAASPAQASPATIYFSQRASGHFEGNHFAIVALLFVGIATIIAIWLSNGGWDSITGSTHDRYATVASTPEQYGAAARNNFGDLDTMHRESGEEIDKTKAFIGAPDSVVDEGNPAVDGVTSATLNTVPEPSAVSFPQHVDVDSAPRSDWALPQKFADPNWKYVNYQGWTLGIDGLQEEGDLANISFARSLYGSINDGHGQPTKKSGTETFAGHTVTYVIQ